MLRSAIRLLAPRSCRREDLIFTDMCGFTPLKKRRIDDLHLVAYEFEHVATGALYYHIDVDDSNNTFCIGFRTPALNNKGTSHVLEHTTLCGSHKYPVRDPFFMMMKRSLSSFMNAMTGSDYTLYPFSTTNEKDFENLLDVYLDAVFHPLLREEDFKQEGHRVELEDKSEDQAGKEGEKDKRTRRLVHNGVVFNEMRGVVSDPNHCFVRSLMSTMLPHTHYTYISGGYPPCILRLSYVELLFYQKRHYHPTNSITFTYGNQHPQRHMEALSSYFKSFTRAERVAVPTLTRENRFTEPQLVQLEGPLDAMGNPQHQKRVAVSYGVPEENNKLEDIVALSVLDSLLSSGPSSPMFKNLIESQIGSKYAPMKGYAFYLSSPVITYGVAGVDEERADAEGEVLRAVESALRTVQTDGFDARRVRSVIFQEELQHRHRSADYGLNTCTGLCAMGLCRAQNNPLDFINWLPHLQQLAKDNAASLLPRIESHMLGNPHRAVVSVSAKKDYLNNLQEQLKEMDEEVNAAATEDDKDRIEEETKGWLSRLRAPQPQDVLPTLRICDIPTESFAEPVPRRTHLSTNNNGEVYTIAYPTNGLVYVHGLIPFHASLTDAVAHSDLSKGPQSLMFVQSLLGQTGAGALSYKDHSIAAELACSGFGFIPLLNESYLHRGTTITGTAYGFYTTKEKLREALELFSTTLLEPRVSADDADVYTRALSSMKMACSSAIQSLQSEGNRYAVTRAVAELTRRGQLREHWYGLSQSTHASDVLEKLQGSTEECQTVVRALLQDYAVFTREMAADMSRSVMWATCEEGHQAEVQLLLKDFLSMFPSRASKAKTHLFLPTREVTPGVQRIDRKLPIDTSFVGLAIPNNLSWEHPDQAKVRVAVLLLCNEYLHRRVREEGGAYGSNCAATLHGEVGGISMSSYRDPNPELTAKAFLEAGDWLCGKDVTAARVDEAKLRLFASIDSPYAADSYGEAYFYHDVRQPTKQLMRDSLLSVTPQDVMDVAHYFKPEGKPTIVSVLQPMGGSKAEATAAQI
ncbi:putative mitochondrial pitrilysin-like metalloprotease,metallo-peptidase, Clan ME, Family M16C [Leptomonas pyrrhocoris]|uniref:Putative mitochondrial pitrilysin-like metalloprotease,metallo-peptidase, Clan ME, Family M16C n=1 Tax=Leptomonas pyrrhocoris TaxID=157538 RepID=A0A0N0VCS6_LEPPY|nr:putative mitochondrial pitrilysin-like metalloprotease,metallo-peptidase, Clan ME, Family M16C [Leptomonas pyrrhocoris]XP_015651664.1 putative mitochondrial pitrilysin-like metalloprotease,metallo-peptidase, Clan ME, Family M16C [Leptomonas pyrrhocoris]KPA73224.1 putative mitochondrial pitrilysin-like metalloprotease,metallo-peptidase, Clan ME, Family M16C [Leptomonas pyrrhocoris]KPA73225.1 putative mitochondrial pitrilysin-like metalloprotease,metallo-peptidase, Clan ME, Family M16C [Leptomo|eukprot:XP_015651663.1 putative mitochondrial pitrilysin-like metalloprotease,metallo-peptidase, Clan ME, Family M16C [Leptomonas pyrrhocoris]